MEEMLGSTPGTFGHPFRHLTEIDSTNEEALRWATSEAVPEGALVVADSQTAGRGRWGRTWLSPGSSLLMSLILRPPWSGEKAGMLPLACGLALAQTLDGSGFQDVAIKWPNDVLVGGKKVAGILVESRFRSPGPQVVVVGIGINMTGAPELPPEIAERATDLATAAEASGISCPGRPALLEALLRHLEARYRELGAPDGVASVRAGVVPRLAMLGSEVVVRSATGDRLEGVAADLGPDGSLLLRTEAGTQAIHAAEIEHVRAR